MSEGAPARLLTSTLTLLSFAQLAGMERASRGMSCFVSLTSRVPWEGTSSQWDSKATTCIPCGGGSVGTGDGPVQPAASSARAASSTSAATRPAGRQHASCGLYTTVDGCRCRRGGLCGPALAE